MIGYVSLGFDPFLLKAPLSSGSWGGPALRISESIASGDPKWIDPWVSGFLGANGGPCSLLGQSEVRRPQRLPPTKQWVGGFDCFPNYSLQDQGSKNPNHQLRVA